MNDLLCTAALRQEAAVFQTVFKDDRRRQQLLYAVADELDKLRSLISQVVSFEDDIVFRSHGDHILPTKLLRELRANIPPTK